jgi:hypothetical protein
VSGESAVIAFLSDPTYDIPLVLAVVLGALLGWWARARSATLPEMTPRFGHDWWNKRPDTVAFVALSQGRYFLTLSGLWLRFSTVVREHLNIRVEVSHELDRASMSAELPEPLTLRRVARNLARAYHSAYLAERPSWLELRWPWLGRRQQRRAARDFARAVADLEVALPVLEAM